MSVTPTSSASERILTHSGVITTGWSNKLARFIYFLNAAIIISGLAYFTARQQKGAYRCKTVNVLFNEEIWENAAVYDPEEDITEERLLIYTYFNGKYKETGYHGGYPKYTEQNKDDGNAFHSTVGAEIIYCSEIGSWVFTHPHISTSSDGNEENENECSWLLRSQETEDYELASANGGTWDVWVSEVKPLTQVSITCIECSEKSDCNYHGVCNEKSRQCECTGSYYGDSCEFEIPCDSLATEKAQQMNEETGSIKWAQENPIRRIKERNIYNRPLYIQTDLSGEPYDMRLHKILEKENSSKPSNSPSKKPANCSCDASGDGCILCGVTPENKCVCTYARGSGSSEETNLYTQNEYDTNSDFADWDDFFESKPLHDLEDILEDYSVILSYSGSRFFGTIVESSASVDDIFPPNDYHAFWDQSFDVNRTFIISDTTFGGTPVGVDFFEMRRRINSLRNPNVEFSYGPFGALIPLMDYKNAGFFHCFQGVPAPSGAPSSSLEPTLTTKPTNPSTLTPASFPNISPTSAVPSSVSPSSSTVPSSSTHPSVRPTSSTHPTSSAHPSTSPSSSTPPSSSTIPTTWSPTSPIPYDATYYNGFERATFPRDLEWSADGDEVWQLTTDRANGGIYSIKSPDLSSVDATPRSARVVFITGADWEAGSLFFSILADVELPFGSLSFFVDGNLEDQFTGMPEFESHSISLEAGWHQIEFSYRYNPFGVKLFPSVLSDSLGAVFIDDVYFIPDTHYKVGEPTFVGSYSPTDAWPTYHPTISPPED